MFEESKMEVLHEPRMDTLLMVEKAIIDMKHYPKRMELWRCLPTKIQYQTFQRILNYLEASNKIIFDNNKIVYTGVDNSKLRALMESSVHVR